MPSRDLRDTALRRERERGADSLAPVYFLSLTLDRVRCFSAPLTIDFAAGVGRRPGRPAQFTFLLGDNGIGKTTVLQALAALAPVRVESHLGPGPARAASPTAQRFLHFPGDFNIWETFPRRGEERSRISAVLSRGVRLVGEGGLARGGESVIELSGAPFRDDGVISYRITDDLPHMSCIAYGAPRRAGAQHAGTRSSDPTASLFSDDALLRDPEDWLVQAEHWAGRSSALR